MELPWCSFDGTINIWGGYSCGDCKWKCDYCKVKCCNQHLTIIKNGHLVLVKGQYTRQHGMCIKCIRRGRHNCVVGKIVISQSLIEEIRNDYGKSRYGKDGTRSHSWED